MTNATGYETSIIDFLPGISNGGGRLFEGPQSTQKFQSPRVFGRADPGLDLTS